VSNRRRFFCAAALFEVLLLVVYFGFELILLRHSAMIASGSAYVALPQPVTYTRASLLVLRQQAMPILSSDVIARVHILGIRRHRGRRAGRHVSHRTWARRPATVLRRVCNGAYTVCGGRPPPSAQRCVYGSDLRNLLHVSIVAQRRAEPTQWRITAAVDTRQVCFY